MKPSYSFQSINTEASHSHKGSIEMVESVGDDHVTLLNGEHLVRAITKCEKNDPAINTESSSNAQVAVNIFISFLGAGMLGIPRAMQQAGWFLGSVTLCSTSAMNVYAMLLLSKVRRRLHEQTLAEPVGVAQNQIIDSDEDERICPFEISIPDHDTYGGIARILLGPVGEYIVNACLMITQTSFATAYIIFIAESLEHLAPRSIVCLACIPGLGLLVQVRNMRQLAPFSLIASLATFVGLSAVLWEDFKTMTGSNNLPPVEQSVVEQTINAFRWQGTFYVMSITLYSMEGVGLILSLESSCQNRSDFPSLLRLVLIAVTGFMCMFGSLSYAAFGDDTLSPITLNLGHSTAATVVQGALCVALYLTYPVMMFPVWNICEERIMHTESQLHTSCVRVGVVMISSAIAFGVPDFGDYLSLVGSSLCLALAFLFPCYFHMKLFLGELSIPEIGFNLFLIMGGTVFGTVSTAQSFVNLMHASHKDSLP